MQGMTGPAGPAGPAGADSMDGAAGDSVSLAMIWEAIAGQTIANYLRMQVGAAGPLAVSALQEAISATAAMYRIEVAAVTSALAYLDGEYPAYETLRRTEVTSFLTALHAGGYLPATRDSAAVVLMGAAGPQGEMGAMGPQGEQGDPGTPASISDVWYAIAGDTIRMDLVASFGTTGPRTVAQLNAAISAIADKYGLDAASALAYLEAENARRMNRFGALR